ncbi:MAG: hypothetical protein IJY70_01545, partial [Clostridia bacterium]|nr:hypothetical protein [Clostridia bacterium]
MVNECVLRSTDDIVDRSTIRDSASEIRNEDIKREVDKFESLIYAVRNVGAFVVAKSFYDGPFSLTINEKTVCNDFYDKVLPVFEDYDEYDYDDLDLIKTLSMKELTEMITILMGGCIAQEIIMEENYGNIRYYHIVANTILKYILSTGFLGANHTVYSFRENVLSYSSKRERELNEKLDKIMIECCEKARVIVEENIHLIDDLALCLADKKELNENETRNFLSNWTYVDDENDDKNE